MRFTGAMMTTAPIRTSTPTKDAGQIMGQEGDESLPWKLPVIIVGPILVVLGKKLNKTFFSLNSWLISA